MKHLFYRLSICFLTFLLFFSITQLYLFAESNNNTYSHSALNVKLNGTTQQNEWTLSGNTPPGQLQDEAGTMFNFYDSSPVDFSLATTLEDIVAGTYTVTLVAHVDHDLHNDAGFKVTTYASDLSPQTKTIELTNTNSSWGNPREYTLHNVVVGENGQLKLDWAVKTLGENYGFIKSISVDSSNTLTSNGLTINDAPTNWTVLHETAPATFKDGSNDDYTFLEYWNESEYAIHLLTSAQLLPNTSYALSTFAHGSLALNSGSKIKVTTTEDEYELVFNPSGLYASPSSINQNNFFQTGNNGLATIELIIDAPAEYYGYITNLQLTAGALLDSLHIKPSASLLRIGYTQSLFNSHTEYDSYTYQSANSSIATVNSNGLITAISEGETTITINAYNNDVLEAQGTTKVYVSDTFQSLASYESVQVEPVQALQDEARSDFIMGADISTIEQLELTGRQFYNESGEAESLVTILKDSGVNWIRVRSWVDPFDQNGNPYGAGNVDAEATVRIAKQAIDAGLNVLLDIHYSDFWTDPARQSKPKQWANLNEADLKDEVYNYTYSLLEEMYDNDALPQMVQIGNEINGGFLWPLSGSSSTASGRGISNAVPYLEKGIEAVRDFEFDYDTDRVDLVIHRTNLNDGLNKVIEFYDELVNLDYDIIGLSYYPFWHGSVANMQNIMNEVANKYDKAVAIVELSYAYGLDEPLYNGTTSNSFGENLQQIGGYAATVQGQTNAIRDVIHAVANVPNEKGIGVFYWEPAWLPGTDVPWGTSYAASYQGETITNNEGSAWVNQALLNQFGEKLPSLDVFKRVRESGTYTPPTVVSITNLNLTTNVGESNVLPTTMTVLFSDDQYRNISVISYLPQSYDANTAGIYQLIGEVQGGATFNVTVTVRPTNHVINGGLETSQTSAWTLSGASISTEKPYTGSHSIHFWNVQQVVAKQTLTNLPNGKYSLSAYTRIGIDGETIENTSRLYAKTSSSEFSSPLVVTGWQDWAQITVTDIIVTNGQLEIGIVVDNGIDNYGDFDDFELILVEASEEPNPNTPNPVTPTPTTSPITNIGFNRTSDNEYSISVEQDTPLQFNQSLLSSLINEQLVIDYPSINFSIQGNQLSSFNVLSFSSDSVDAIFTSPNGGQLNIIASLTIEANSNQRITVTINRETSDPTVALYYIDARGNLIFAGGYWKDNQYIVSLEPNKTYVFSQNRKAYEDVNEQSDAVQFFTAAGIVSGDNNNNLLLDRPATRLEFAKIVSTLFGLHTNGSESSNGNNTAFQDVDSSSWALPYVNAVLNSGIMNGISQNSFGATEHLTAEQLLVVFARAANIEPHAASNASTISNWAIGYVDAIVEAGYISQSDITQLDLKAPLSKESIMELLYALYSNMPLK